MLPNQQTTFVERQIQEAFGSTVPPGPMNIAASEEDTDCYECELIRKTFNSQRWQEVSIAMVLVDVAALSFFTPAGLCYYLPAYMKYGLNGPESLGIAFDRLINVLQLPWSEESDRDESDFKEKFSGLNQKQRQAVSLFLEHVKNKFPDEVNTDHIEWSLLHYWRV